MGTFATPELERFIRQHSFLKGAPIELVRMVSAHAHVRNVLAGQVLFREGMRADRFYLIVTGTVVLEIARHGYTARPVQTLRAGEALGWSWLFAPHLWHYQARTVLNSELIECDARQLLERAESSPEFGYELMKRVSQLLIGRLHSTQQQLLQQWSAVHKRKCPAP